MRAMRCACVHACARARKMSPRYARPRASLPRDNQRQLLILSWSNDPRPGRSVEKCCCGVQKSCKKFWLIHGNCLSLQRQT